MRKPVLTIFYQFDPWNPTIGGIQTVIRNFIKFSPDQFDIQVVGNYEGNSEQPIGQWQDREVYGRSLRFLPVLSLPNDNVRGRVPTTLKYTLALLKHSIVSDFMHFHRLEPSLASILWKGEKAFFIHNDIRQQMQASEASEDRKAILWRHVPQAYYALEGLLVKQFTQIFSCNSEAVSLYQQRYPEIASRVSYVRNTVDNEIFYPWSLEERNQKRVEYAKQKGLPDQTRFVLFAGRLHPQKNPLLLVRAFTELQDLPVHLLIAGEGELAQDVQTEISRLGLTSCITMLGSVPLERLADIHRFSSALVLTSLYEGLPMVVLEALACGTPIVTTYCGETPKILSSDSGVVCENGSPQEIAAAIRQVLVQSQDYPQEACVQAAKPYAAQTVVQAIYDDMWQRWQCATQNQAYSVS
jgi:glycosyltransferase involved in cell wall biosynthesis